MPSGVYKRTAEMKTGKHMLGRKLSSKTIEKIKTSNVKTQFKKGHKHSKEVIKKISDTNKGNKNKKGKKASTETLEKMRQHRLMLYKDKTKHPRWISDRTLLKRFNDTAKDRRSYAYNEWRKRVWLRDDWKCKISNQDCKGRLEAHHILGFTAHPELRYDINNGITLCHFHHPRKREDEINLSPYFTELVMNIK